MTRPTSPTVYVLPLGMRPDESTGGLLIWTKPPLHKVKVFQEGNLWKGSFYTMPNPRVVVYASRDQAVYESGRIIGRLGGLEMRDLFTGAQRVAMGRQVCPYDLGDHVCGQPADVGTVWCVAHVDGRTPQGRRRA